MNKRCFPHVPRNPRLRPLRMAVLFAAIAAAAGLRADDDVEPAMSEHSRKWLSLSAYADIESAYVARGYIWDTRPYSAQYASGTADLGAFGAVEAFVWSYSATTDRGTSADMTRYAYAEVDYAVRYYYDVDLAEGWRLRNGFGHQWVTSPGYSGGHTLMDWQALQVLKTPWVTPYWRLRLIRRPIDEAFWVVGAKRSFELCEGLTFTADFFGDIGDSRHFRDLYGPNRRKASGSWRGGLQALNLVLRLDYRLSEHVSLFGYVGQFCLVHDDARRAVKAASGPEMRRDITHGGIGIALDF